MGDDPFRHIPAENENYKLAHKYMELYAESLVDEYKAKKENAYLIRSLDAITSELKDIKNELAGLKRANAKLSENFKYLDFTRLTVGIDGTERVKSVASANEGKSELHMDNLNISDSAPVESPAPSAPPEEKGAKKQKTKKEKAKKEKQKTGNDKSKISKIVSNVIFYSCMALLIIGAVAFVNNENADKSLFGYRYYYIKSGSMEPVLPIGSIVITKVTPPEEINVGDDITIFISGSSNDSYLTHRVVEIIPDADGGLSFLTKGVNNRTNDPTPFSASLVVGRVVFCIPKLGTVMIFVQDQLLLVVGIFVLLLALSFMLRLLFGKNTETTVEVLELKDQSLASGVVDDTADADFIADILKKAKQRTED